ncbi:unnamed protein product, partial [Discosporangium mesarthrocarpum]
LSDFSEEKCWNAFRFRPQNISAFLRLLGIPEHVISGNRRRHAGMEALLFFLCRLRYLNRLDDVSIRMGREYTQMERVVKNMAYMLVKMFGHMLSDGIWACATYFDRATRPRGEDKDLFFVDITHRPHFRPAGDVAQVATYSGYKRSHDIKFHGSLPPNDIIADLWGPTVGRHQDGYLMRSMHDKLRNPQEGNPTQYYVHGDTAYAGIQEMAAGLSQSQSQENEAMSVCRVGVGNPLGKVCKLWGFLDHKRNLKLMQSPIGYLFLVRVLLTNVHTGVYGSRVTEYYREPP